MKFIENSQRNQDQNRFLFEQNKRLKIKVEQKSKMLLEKDRIIYELKSKLQKCQVSIHRISFLETKIQKMSDLLTQLERKNKIDYVIQDRFKKQKTKNETINEKFQKLKQKIDAEKNRITKKKEDIQHSPPVIISQPPKNSILNVLNKQNYPQRTQYSAIPPTPSFKGHSRNHKSALSNLLSLNISKKEELPKQIVNKTIDYLYHDNSHIKKKKNCSFYGFENLKRERIISSPNMDELLRVRKCYTRDQTK